MRPLLRPLIALILFTMILVACSRENDDDNSSGVTFPGAGDALIGYWDAGDDVGEALTAADGHWETFAALAEDPASPAPDALVAARGYASACSLAADLLDDWADLERMVTPYTGGKAQLTEGSRAAALATLETAARSALEGGESLIVGWQILGGLASPRVAFAEPEGTIPVNGWLADDLDQRLAVRDDLITTAILDGNDRSGRLALDQLAGSDGPSRALAYAELGDDDPLKLAFRASVPAWHGPELDASMTRLERAARGRLRQFEDVGTGGASVADLAGHLTGAGEQSADIHEITLELREKTGGILDQPALVVIRRLELHDTQPRVALLAGVTGSATLRVPSGTYDILALANGWSRAVASDVTTSNGAVVALDLSDLEADAIILDGIDAPAMSGMGGQITVAALSASTTGDDLDFEWEVTGGAMRSFIEAGSRCSFIPEDTGTYTIEVTVRDGHGNARTTTTTVEIKPFAVRVFRTEFLDEQVPDLKLNPGEDDTIQFWVANRGDNDVVGRAAIDGRNGIDVHVESGDWTLGAGRQTRWKVPVSIPVDYDQDRAYLDFSFTVDGETLVQELDYGVDFYVEMSYIRSPVTSRIMTVSGTVANPSLEVAELVIDRDRDAVYQLPLENGAFEQVIILPGSADTRRVRVSVAAESGNRREEAGAGFMATIVPADFRATLFWDTNETDVDLWVTDPSGEKCYYAHKNTASGLDLDVDDVTGYGPENITGESDLPAGEYLVQIHYYSDHGTNLPSFCTVMITLHEGTDDKEVTVYEATISDGDVWTVATVVWDGSQVARVVPSNGAVVTAPSSLPAK